MPISIQGAVIGVMQMVNKMGGQAAVFSAEDEEAFRVFSVYCGLALHYAKLYDKIRRSEQKLKVTLEVLSYHSSATAHDLAEVEQLEKISTPINVRALAAYDWSVPGILNYQAQPLGSPTTGQSSLTTGRLTKWSPCSTISSGRRDLNWELWSGNFSLFKV